MKRTALILAGGAGTRLWPLSTNERPKQFLDIFAGESLLQRTWSRLADLNGDENIWIATTAGYRDLVATQLPRLDARRILVEPSRRNTAPAIAACAALVRATMGDVVMGVFPSDHAIADEQAFASVAERAYDFASRGTHLVTIGIEPDSPNVNYGYLEIGEPLADGVAHARRFVEKPDLATATQYVESGRYLWNAGMFVWHSAAFDAALAAGAPRLADQVREWAAAADETARDSIYSSMEALSVDYALMEKAPNVAIVPGSFGWSDIGNWSALARFTSDSDSVYRLRSEGSRVISTTGRPVAVVGLPNVLVVETERGLLILNPDDDSGLSDLVKSIDG